MYYTIIINIIFFLQGYKMNNTNEVFVKINFLLPTLPKAEKIIAKYILANPESIRNMNLLILAQEAGSSDTSVIRFCKRLGYDGFTDFKQAFMESMVDSNVNITEEISSEDSMDEILKKVLQHHIQTLNDTLALVSDSYSKALEAILNAKSVHFFGVGDAHVVAELGFMKFSRIGYTSSAHSDVYSQLLTSSLMRKGDVAIAISYSGSSTNIVKAMQNAKEHGATVICITQVGKSPLLKYTDINLFISTSDLTVGKDIVSRRIADQFIIEALYLGTLTKSERNLGDYIKITQKGIDLNKI